MIFYLYLRVSASEAVVWWALVLIGKLRQKLLLIAVVLVGSISNSCDSISSNTSRSDSGSDSGDGGSKGSFSLVRKIN